MRLRVVLALAVVGLFAAAPAIATAQEAEAQFPDLPGMKLADEATRGEVAPSKARRQQDTGAPGASGASSKARNASFPDVGPIVGLPGTAAIPGVSNIDADLTSARIEVRGTEPPRGLAAFAAIGTILSVGGFLVFRRMLVP